jgi:hypothetical protein
MKKVYFIEIGNDQYAINLRAVETVFFNDTAQQTTIITSNNSVVVTDDGTLFKDISAQVQAVAEEKQ